LGVHFLDEVLEHGLDHVEVGDDAVLEGAYGDDVAGRLAYHGFGLGSHRVGLAAIALINGHHRGLGHDDALTPHVNESICGTQVYAQVAAEKAEQSVQWAYHEWRCSSRPACPPAAYTAWCPHQAQARQTCRPIIKRPLSNCRSQQRRHAAPQL